MPIIEICRSNTGWPRRRPQRYYWRVTAANGRILAVSSEMYTNADDCRRIATMLFHPTLPVPIADGITNTKRRRS